MYGDVGRKVLNEIIHVDQVIEAPVGLSAVRARPWPGEHRRDVGLKRKREAIEQSHELVARVTTDVKQEVAGRRLGEAREQPQGVSDEGAYIRGNMPKRSVLAKKS